MKKLNSKLFKQLKKSELKQIKGGDKVTWPWSDTNFSTETNSPNDVNTGYSKDNTKTNTDMPSS
ncbi:MAG: hypothetical protein U0W65_09420 [Bacteroidia bacterium]|jgi:bacteriocin-like protein